jgi:hypothetical protein
MILRGEVGTSSVRALVDHLSHAVCPWLGAEVGEDPGGPGPLPRVELGARLEIDDEVERLAIVASLLGDRVAVRARVQVRGSA